MKTRFVLLTAAVVLTLSGCASSGKRDSAEATPPPALQTRPMVDYEAQQRERALREAELRAQADAEAEARRRQAEIGLAENVVYFEFDSASLNEQGRAIVSAYARFLRDNPSTRIRLEGHSDERGTREYNIGLGERRTQAVEQALLSQGVSPVQLVKLSYGEERPVCGESNEACWSQNRRVELIRL